MNQRFVPYALLAALTSLVAVSLWRASVEREHGQMAVIRHPRGIMGTSCAIVAVAGPAGERQAERAAAAAEIGIRSIESRMSTWIADSEISRFNAGADVRLSTDTVEVLRRAEAAHRETGGAFDITARPLIELWKNAGKTGSPPSPADMQSAKDLSNWDSIRFENGNAVHVSGTASVDLGGIAKGYAIDKALDALRENGLPGGLVDIGGDLACFRGRGKGEPWVVDIRHPFGDEPLGSVGIRNGAVCTSGNYERYVEIGGVRRSHIIDPRTGTPADAVPSVTVLAPDAMTADIWATALSVLGEDGFASLPASVEALMVLGTAEEYRMVCTWGFAELMDAPLPESLAVFRDSGARRPPRETVPARP